MKQNKSRLSAMFLMLTAGVATLAMAHGAAAESTLRIRLNADIRSSEPGVNRDGWQSAGRVVECFR
jgi:peptide/nickel transport system substrate-binding protein